jgi:aryl-alcohol dehydrogenase-like predicted oxidoreductase
MDVMNIQLGKTELQVSPIGVGTNRWGRNRNAEASLRETFDAALQAGFNLFDTAEIYNIGGSEKTLGLFLPETQLPLTVTSKFLPLPWRPGKKALFKALQDSLKRLNREFIDLYLIHIPLPPVPIATWMEALAEAKQAGLVRAVGVSNYNEARMRKAQAVLARFDIPLACNEVEYSLMKRDPERNGVKAACEELGITLMAYRPFAGGYLTGKHSAQNPPTGPRRWMYPVGDVNRIAALLERMAGIGQVHGGKTIPQVALNWLLCKGSLPIPGATKVKHIEENAGAMGWQLNQEEVAALDSEADKMIM